MKNILCFGDSNTFGFIPGSGERYKKDERWSGIISNLLDSDYAVTEAGCNNRTAFCINPAGDLFTGTKAIIPYLKNHDDWDLIILAVGANDLQFAYNVSYDEIYNGISSLVKLIQSSSSAKILLVCPSKIRKNVLNSFFSQMFDETSIEKSLHLPEIYEKISKEQNVCCLDLNNIAEVSDTDGLHYTKDAHRLIANAVAKIINIIFQKEN